MLIAFTLGAVAHWVSIIIYRQSKRHTPVVLYLDSRNLNYLSWDEADIVPLVDARDEYLNQLTGRKPRLPFFTNCFKQSIFDIRMLFTYLQQVLNGEFTFYQFYMKRLLHNVMKSFEN